MATKVCLSALNLSFAMDCTGSMGSYIKSATDNIRAIVDEIMSKETVDIELALIEYRDHPPQDTTFVTRVHDFTKKVPEMKSWLEQCTATGGGDTPEAVADALHDVLNLSWRPESTKICVLISDAPPHGLKQCTDSFPDGCPLGYDPLKLARDMAARHITLYVVGVEPPVVPYREFFMALAHITGGQYVPMTNAGNLAKMIVAAVREEISIDHVMNNSRADITKVVQQATADGITEQEAAKRLQSVLESKKVRVNRMNNEAGIPSTDAEESYAKCLDMADIQGKYKRSEPTSSEKVAAMDYRLEEEATVSTEQAKRILQKAKNWNIPKGDTTRSSDKNVTSKSTHSVRTEHRKSDTHRGSRIQCRHGQRCHDFSEEHRAKYDHPSADKSESRDNTHTIPCKYGADCYDTSSYHRAKYSHSTSGKQEETRRNEGTTCRYGAECHDFSDDHRDKYSHPSNDKNHATTKNSPTQCKFGLNCHDFSERHRRKYLHPTA